MPSTPNPPEDGLVQISNALELAITTNIRTSFVPGIGAMFIANLSNPNSFLLSLGAYLDVTITPIISTAAGLQSSMGQLPAWTSVQPSFDALLSSVPPFMGGEFGALFWQAILLTIRTALSPSG